jgi:DNA-binding beta-propeller fold protein YncE
MRVLIAALVACAALLGASASADAATKKVIAIGNASGGTVSFLDGTTYNNLGSINVTTDLAARKLAIFLNPINLIGWNVVKGQKGGERIVDDVALSPDGKTIYVSRGMLRDTVAYSLVTKKQLWRRDVGSFNSDHMAMSPDGKRVVVSATTAKKAQVIDTANGNIVDSFETGDYPHENTFSADGKRVYNFSIGTTALPYELNDLKGQKQITVVDSTNFNLIKKFEFEHGVRPSVLIDDEQSVYAQLSYTRGFAEINLNNGQIVRRANQPATAEGQALFWDNLPSNSAHHGLAMNGAATKFCNAGTIDNYVSIVNRGDFSTQSIVNGFKKPYWAVTTPNGSDCLISNSDGNYISVVSYATGLETRRIPVGVYPQRERLGNLEASVIPGLSRAAG